MKTDRVQPSRRNEFRELVLVVCLAALLIVASL